MTSHRLVLRATLAALALPLALHGASASAQHAEETAAYQIHMRSLPSADSVAAWTLGIAGVWPTACAPTLERVRLDGSDLRIEMRSALDLCARHPTPFSAEINPATAIGQLALAPGNYRVRLYAADGAQAQQQLRAFALINASNKSGTAIEPEAGFWWTETTSGPDATGTVISLEQQGRQLSVALMTFESSGDPVWRFGSAPLVGPNAHVRLIRPEGGSDPFARIASLPRVESEINLDLEFRSSALATAWLSRSGGDPADPVLELRELKLARLPFSAVANGSGWKGDWVLVADRGKSAPQRLRFDQFEPLESDRFRLSDSASGMRLYCQRNAARADAPPQSCQLRGADGQELGHFDGVAISRLDGVAADGSRLQMIRVSR